MKYPVPIRSHDGKVIGQVRADGTFYKRVLGSKHMLHTPPAWAVDLSSIRYAQTVGAKRVVIYDRETKITYEATLLHFHKHHFRLDRDFGAQVALPLEFWTVHSANPPIQTTLF